MALATLYRIDHELGYCTLELPIINPITEAIERREYLSDSRNVGIYLSSRPVFIGLDGNLGLNLKITIQSKSEYDLGLSVRSDKDVARIHLGKETEEVKREDINSHYLVGLIQKHHSRIPILLTSALTIFANKHNCNISIPRSDIITKILPLEVRTIVPLRIVKLDFDEADQHTHESLIKSIAREIDYILNDFGHATTSHT